MPSMMLPFYAIYIYVCVNNFVVSKAVFDDQ